LPCLAANRWDRPEEESPVVKRRQFRGRRARRDVRDARRLGDGRDHSLCHATPIGPNDRHDVLLDQCLRCFYPFGGIALIVLGNHAQFLAVDTPGGIDKFDRQAGAIKGAFAIRRVGTRQRGEESRYGPVSPAATGVVGLCPPVQAAIVRERLANTTGSIWRLVMSSPSF